MTERAPLDPLDFALGEGTASERRRAAARHAADPQAAGELGETFDLLQQIRGQRASLRPGFNERLVAAEARHHTRLAGRARSRRIVLFAAAAAALLLAAFARWPLARAEAPLIAFGAGALDYVGERQVALQMQRLASAVAASLPRRLQDAGTDPEEIARAASALVASGQAHNGAPFGPDLHAASTWLEQRLPQLHGARLARALAALGEVAASTGSAVAVLRVHGQRFVDESLAEPGSAPAAGLLATAAPAADLADAGRLLAIAAAFGVDRDACARLRRILADELAGRCRRDGESPELLAAQLYGFGNLVDRAAIDRELGAWRPDVIAAADLPALHRMAASIEPRGRGRTELVLRLRHLATCPVPAAPVAQADVLLCLARCSFLSRAPSFERMVAYANRT